MVKRILSFVKRPTSLHIIINTLGNYLNVFFIALFALILVRILTPSQYGVLSVLLGIAYVLANILDFGTTATIYSYLPSIIETKTGKIYRFIKSNLFYQSLFSSIIITILFITFPHLDKVFFKTNAPAWELYLTSISVLFFIWQNFILNVLFAAKKFFKANLYLNLANLIKTLIVFFLVLTKTVSVGSVIFVFGILGPVIFFILLFFDKRRLIFLLLKSEIKKEEFRLGYTLTNFLASQFFNLGLRMDLFLLSYFLVNKEQVGYYGLSQKIILTILTTVSSITQVLSPAFSKIKTKQEVKHQLKTGLLYLGLPSFLFIVIFFLPPSIFNLLFTEKFAKTALITKALSLPFIIYSLGNIPLLFVLYTIKKPKYTFLSNVVFFIVLTVGCYLLIPKLGVFGPPYAIFAALFLSIFILTCASVLEYKKLPR